MPKHFHVNKSMGATYDNPVERLDTTKRYWGIYTGVVEFNKDSSRTGKVSVYISEFNRDPTQRLLFDAMYTSPFYGLSDPVHSNADDITQDRNARTSYGMWTPPPDVGNTVLVSFADGLLSKPFIMGHAMVTPYNQMVPGIAGGPSFQGGPFNTPTVEKNQYDTDTKNNGKLRPIFHDFAENITKQGLINDPLRGATSSSARRETPSEVLGILSKGPRDDEGRPIGPGHQFIMDDAPENSNIRVRTGGGNQILLDDTTGCIYVINKTGTAWFELDRNGNINFFGEGSMSIRSKGDFNLRADKNINIEAGNDVNIKATGDNSEVAGYLGISGKLGALGVPPLGTGGNLRFHSAADTSIHATLNAQITANAGDLQINSAGRLTLTSTTSAAIQSQGFTTVQASGKVDVLAGGAATLSAGGTTNIFGTTIGLNNLGTVPTPDLVPAVPAPQLGGTEQPDQSSTPPEYDRDEDNPILNGGQRPEKGPAISTIVGKLITAEPYAGHGSYDPISEDPTSIEEDETADGETLENQIDPTDTTPADADTPEGTKIGKGFADARDKIGDLKDEFDDATAGIKSVYAEYNAMLSNFMSLKNLNLKSIEGITKMAGMLGIVIPPFRIPTTNSIMQKIIGQSKILTDLEARLKQFSLDGLGLPLDLQDTVVKGMKGDISGVVNNVTGGKVEEFKSAAKAKVEGAIKNAQGQGGNNNGG
jgi:hypothetical protein